MPADQPYSTDRPAESVHGLGNEEKVPTDQHAKPDKDLTDQEKLPTVRPVEELENEQKKQAKKPGKSNEELKNKQNSEQDVQRDKNKLDTKDGLPTAVEEVKDNPEHIQDDQRNETVRLATDNRLKVERRTNSSFIIKWTKGSGTGWKLSIDRHRSDKPEEIELPPGTTSYTIDNVNEGDTFDIAFFDGFWHESFQYKHEDSESSTSSILTAKGKIYL